MDKNVVDALKTLLEALREEVVTEVTSKLNPSASHIPEENSKQMTAKVRAKQPFSKRRWPLSIAWTRTGKTTGCLNLQS